MLLLLNSRRKTVSVYLFTNKRSFTFILNSYSGISDTLVTMDSQISHFKSLQQKFSVIERPLAQPKSKPKPKPKERKQQIYPYEKKLQVLRFIREKNNEESRQNACTEGVSRNSAKSKRVLNACIKKASSFFKMPESTVRDWYNKRREIERGSPALHQSYWRTLEAKLSKEFLERRNKQKVTYLSWFRIRAEQLALQLRPQQTGIFTFTKGWWTNFCQYDNIVQRGSVKETGKNKKVNEENKRVKTENGITANWLQHIRTISNEKVPAKINIDVNSRASPPRRFEKSHILNLDEAPLSHRDLVGYTYKSTEAYTNNSSLETSNLGNHYASLVLCIFADGIHRIKPVVIFHGPTDGDDYEEEGRLYSTDVIVKFNETGSNNEKLLLEWIANEFGDKDLKKEHLLVMDVARFHKTDAVLSQLDKHAVTAALIPPRMTSKLQPLDRGVIGAFKNWISHAVESYMHDRKKQGLTEWSPREKRIMTTHVIASAVKKLQEMDQTVWNAFLQCGISVRPDGSQDHEISIADFSVEEYPFYNWDSSNEPFSDAEDVLPLEHDDLEIVYGYEVGILSSSFNKCHVNDLKRMCEERRLETKGKKQDLVKQMMDFEKAMSLASQ
ncbi:DDE superfamily endonuclease domain-containing protein [Trichoderma sp. SZMC 28014]